MVNSLPPANTPCKTSNSYIDYHVQRGYDKPTSGPLIQILPRQKKLYSAQNIACHPVRPSDLPNLWVSKPSDFKYPEFLEFFWDNPVSISSITIHFDPSYEPFPPSLPLV